VKKTLKIILWVTGIYFGAKFIFLIMWLYRPHEHITFKVLNWNNSISKYFNPRLKLIFTGRNGVDKETFADSETYFLYNFSNSLADYELVTSLFMTKYSKPPFFDGLQANESKNVVFSFFWNNFYDVSYLIDEIETSSGSDQIGLFVMSIKYYPKEYYFQNIIGLEKLNVRNIEYKFKRIDNGRIDTDCDSFNFIFWTQAEDFLDQNLNKKIGKKIGFYNSNKKIAEFDYSSGLGYKINLKE